MSERESTPNFAPRRGDFLWLAMGGSFREKQARYGHLWLAEADRYDWNHDDWDVVCCANLADELDHYRVMAEDDADFEDDIEEWRDYLVGKNLLLALEQSCHESVLLPFGQRAMRLVSCPEVMMNPLRFFFAECPVYVQVYLALFLSVAVRLDRAKRTGNPDWRPETAIPAEEERAFFRPPVLRFRNYAR